MATSSAECSTRHCCNLTLLPSDPALTKDCYASSASEMSGGLCQLRDVCTAVLAARPEDVTLMDCRSDSLLHPALPYPLVFLDVTIKLSALPDGATDAQAVAMFDSICEALNAEGHTIGNAEVGLILPSPIPLLPTTLPIVTLDQHSEWVSTATRHFSYSGLVVLEQAMNRSAFDDLKPAVMEYFERCLAALGEHEAHGNGCRFTEIMQRDQMRYDCQLPRDNQALWSSVAETGSWVSVVRELLGGDCKLHKCGVVASLPGCGEQYWHSDGQHGGCSCANCSNVAAGWEDLGDPVAAAAAAHAICVFLPLVDLTLTNGYTEFWPGSQLFAKLLDKKGEQSIPKGTDALMPMGDCLIYDFRTIHRGMPNSSDSKRPIMYMLYGHDEWVEKRNWGERSVFSPVEHND